MFPSRKRLTRSAFEDALHAARRTSSPHFSILIPKHAEGYAVVVSKKTAKLSVTRHRLKRRVREALRSLPIPLPASLILYPRASALDIRYDALREELIKIISSL